MGLETHRFFYARPSRQSPERGPGATVAAKELGNEHRTGLEENLLVYCIIPKTECRESLACRGCWPPEAISPKKAST